ncbi:MAG TPA: AarF/UbiB family protein [Candidatus Limnocylindrales bacterium]|nr:AarF/UbiB family protein [Candidatus Limnocylindrales bacterium]
MRTLFRHPRRVLHVLGVFLRFFVAPALHLPGSDRRSGPVRMRFALERAGGAWIKLGQMLSLRFDLLPSAYCDELFKLLNQVAPFSYAEVRQIIRRELGADPETIFRSFAPASFAAASIGQVHRAVLHSGEPVAVKIQRPGIRATLQADIDLMYAMTWLLDRSHLFGATRSREVIDEFARWTADELDYLVEARQAVLLHEHSKGDRLERIARVYRDYTTSRVLTTELIEGIPLVEIMIAKREGNTAYLEALRAAGHDLDRVVRHLDWNMLNQVYVFGYFHADLHPANLFVLPGDAIGYVDFGIVGQLPDRVRDSLTRYSWLLFRGEVEAAVRELMRWLAPTPATDAAAARWQLIRVHQAFLYDTVADRSRVTAAAPGPVDRGAHNPYSRLAVDILETVREQRLSMSSSVVAYLKMLVTVGTLRHQLAVEYDLQANVRSFVRRLARQQGLAWLDPRRTLDRLYAGTGRLQRALDFLDFLEAQEPVILEAESSLFGFRRRMREARRRLVTLAMSVLAIGTLLYLVLVFPDQVRRLIPETMPYEWVHGGLVVILIMLILTLVRHVRSLGREE